MAREAIFPGQVWSVSYKSVQTAVHHIKKSHKNNSEQMKHHTDQHQRSRENEHLLTKRDKTNATNI